MKKHYSFMNLRKIFLLILCTTILTAFSFSNVNAQVVVTPSSASNICVNGGFQALGTIKIKEGNATDFTGGTGLTYIISAPTNFQFNPGVGSVSTNLVGDISFIGMNVSSSTITIFYDAALVPAVKDSILITGLQVKAITTPASGNILRTGGTAVQLNNAASPVNTQNHGTLTSIQPTVTLSALSAVCSNGNPVSLSGGSPLGGTYSGVGVNASTFYPSFAGAGSFPITYTYTDGFGCTNSAIQNITVNAPASVSLASFSQSSICRNATPIALPAGSPVGGVYTGDGVNGSNFDPSIAAVGTNTVTYTFTDGNGCVTSASKTITVNDKPSITFSALPDKCASASSFSLTSYVTPSGGTFSGTGVTGSNFNPSTAGAGIFTITYSYTNGNGCTNTATQNIDVHALPGVTFSGLNSTYCVNSGVQGLTGFPVGGSFSGPGISGTTFDPNIAGVGGPYTITYSYTDSYGCSATTSNQTSILSIPNVTISGLNDGYATTDNPATIGGTESPSGGTVVVSGHGVSDFSKRFYPDVAGVGTHTIVRTYTAPNGCSASASKTVTVSDNSGGSISGLGSSYCENAPPVTLTGVPAGGSFSGPGITNIGPGKATFNPASATPGVWLIIYTYSSGFISIPFFQFVTVYKQTDGVSFSGLDPNYCEKDPSVTLIGHPAGGTFNGHGISGSNFNPTSAGLGKSYISYTYTNTFGCTNIFIDSTTVWPNPSVDFYNLSSDYCEDGTPISLQGSPRGGVFSGPGMIDTIFYPTIAHTGIGSGSLDITYTYKKIQVGSFGCSSSKTYSTVLNLKPIVSFSGFPSTAAYCIDHTPISLTGSPAGGTFFGTGISGSTFTPSVAGIGSHQVYYEYIENHTFNNCMNRQYDTVTVNPLPVVDFTGLDSTYCHDITSSVQLKGIPSGGIFTGPGVATTNFFTSIAGVGKHDINYQYTDANGCINDTTYSTIVYGRPRAAYIKQDSCEKDVIHFVDKSYLLSLSSAPSKIISRQWKFSDNQTLSDSLTSRTFSPGSYSLNYTVTTDKGCDTTLVSNFTIGPYPVSNFKWKKVCDQDITEFTNLSTISAGSITNYNWDFNDAGASDIIPSPTHKFTSPGIYNVNLKVTSDKNCITIDTQKVFVLPMSSSYPYFADFESGTEGWIASSTYDTSATWALGTPVKSIISTAGSGANSWVTNLTGNYKPSEKSYVYSPCFNLASINRPMVSVKINSASEDIHAGTVLQYSTDEGLSWNVVGQPGDGLNWYNKSNVIGQQGIQSLFQYAWTGNLTNGWITSRHNLNNLNGATRIRFRIAFGSDESGNVSDGFAFDDFFIGDRTKLVLMEHFTNSSSSDTMENNYAYNMVAANKNDMVGLAYHTSFPGNDPMNLRNTADPSARATWYSISEVPKTVIDGNFYNGNTLGFTQSTIDKRSLMDPGFLIDISVNKNSSSISATATMTAQQTINNHVTLYFAAVERSVTAVTGANGETHFQWVLDKLIPDAAGKVFTNTWHAGDVQTVSQSWNYTVGTDVYDNSQLGIIAFVQDNITKEIYQAAYNGPDGPSGPPVLGITTSNESKATEWIVYPSPSAVEANVIYKETLKDDVNYVVYDQFGRVVSHGVAKGGGEGFVVNTSNLTPGMYNIVIGNESEGMIYKKLVVAR